MRISAIGFAALWLTAASMVAFSQTAQYLHAKVLDNAQDLPVRLSTDSKIEWQPVRNGNFSPIPKDDLLLVHSDFRVGYFKYNPLRVKLSVNAVDVDDPAQKALGDLLDALKSVATKIGGAKETLATAQGEQDKKSKAPGFRLSKEFNSKEDAHDAVQKAVDNVGAALDRVKKESNHWVSDIDSGWGNKDETGPKMIDAAVLNADKVLQEPDGTKCDANLLFQKVEPHGIDCIVNVPGNHKILDEKLNDLGVLEYTDTVLIQKIGDLETKALELQKELNSFKSSLTLLKDSRFWSPDGQLFLVDPSIDPTPQTAKNVTITITPLSLDETKLALTDGKAVSVTFNARVYRALFPETGVGAVFGFIERPKYGTGADANGKTIVTLASKDKISVDPAVMVNFVCRCDAGGIAPMLQVGAATSKDLPAVLLGGGLRILQVGTKGDIAVGGGLLLGWYQELQKLKVGDVVKGTSDITADLGYIKTPQPAPYFTIQYKF